MREIRLVAVAVAVFVAMAATSVAVADQDEPGAMEALPQAEPRSEIPADRTATSRTFQLPDGRLETRLYQAPDDYSSGEGRWKPIGESLRSAEGATLIDSAKGFAASLPEQIDTEPARVSVGDQWVSSELVSTEAKPLQLEGDTASYEDTGSGASFNYSGLPDGLKEKIEIAAPSDPSTFSFELSASAGLTASLEEEAVTWLLI